jgi:Na+/H+-dicarboxylate symporter
MARGEILPIIFFSIFFGFFITRLEKQKRQMLEGFFQAMFQVMMKLTRVILFIAPLGIFGYVARTIGETGFQVIGRLGLYMLTVFSSLMIHACITLPLMLYFLAHLGAFHHFKAMLQALVTAFSTASSSATLPVTIRCAEENAGVSNRVSSFVLPLGATINMDGTALYECVAAVFIAQAYGISLTFYEQFIVVITALLASVGAAGIPMAGLVMIFIILKAVGLPDEGVGLILAVDRILDMCRTTVNVWSDSCGAAIIEKSESRRTADPPCQERI